MGACCTNQNKNPNELVTTEKKPEEYSKPVEPEEVPVTSRVEVTKKPEGCNDVKYSL